MCSNNFLSNSVLVFFGKYSYGLYIIHPLVRSISVRVFGDPILINNSQILWQIFFTTFCILLTTGIALLSWHLYEKHFLKLKIYFTPHQKL